MVRIHAGEPPSNLGTQEFNFPTPEFSFDGAGHALLIIVIEHPSPSTLLDRGRGPDSAGRLAFGIVAP